MSDWCILRTAGRSTLRLAESLGGDGLEVWTPARVVSIRRPRWNVRRETRLPILPGFVFAGAQHLWTLVDRSESPGERYPFSVFRHLDHYPVIPDHQLTPLRSEEARVLTKAQRKVYAKGQHVRIPPGLPGVASAFGGLEGIVVRGNDRKTIVLFSGLRRVEFFTFDLKPIDVIQDGIALERAAARKAA